MDLLGWLIFLFALLFSVMAHEAGHFLTAKKFGMRATRFFVGMGPTLWSTRLGETEYGVKAFPIGGFVKIVGMTSMEEVDPADEPRAFRRFPGWQRVIVLAAGSAVHFILAFLLIFCLALGIGIENNNTTQLGTVSGCVPASVSALNSGAACPPGAAKSPAGLAGLRVGDTVTSFDGTAVSNYTQLTTAIKNVKAGTTVPITVLRDGRSVTLHATLASVPGRSGGFLGIAGSTVFQAVGPVRAVTYAGSGFWQVLDGSGKALAQLPAAIPDLFSKNRASTPAGNVSSIVGAANATGQAVAAPVGWQDKVSFVLLLIASLNIFVGAFNLFPLLPLDGGHIALVVWERIRSRIARWRRRPDPGLVDYMKFIPISFSIFSIVVVIGVILILADIVNPVSIG
ncbi:MAG TPA: site-2 protease family protein [Trebonia sp.]|nr:site-2 protease family protein [Trebonia sp.]